MDIVFALDWDPDSRQTFEINFPEAHFELADIREFPIERIRKLVRKQKPNPVLFCGCAPCQPFTKHNTIHPERRSDDRIPLLSRFTSIVNACKPDIVFVENVPGIQKLGRKNQTFGRFLNGLDDAGYHVDYRAVRLMKYGVPQSRYRLILLASRHGLIRLPRETNGPGTDNPEYETVRNWISELPPIAAGEEHSVVPNHRAANLSELNLKRIRATPEGGGHGDWPKRGGLRLDCHKKISGYRDVYGRMSWDRPASGLTTRCISYSNGRFGHPEQNRAISIREAACLQTFPMDFRFEGKLGSMARQIGNAVPVRLAEVVGEAINEHLEQAGVIG